MAAVTTVSQSLKDYHAFHASFLFISSDNQTCTVYKMVSVSRWSLHSYCVINSVGNSSISTIQSFIVIDPLLNEARAWRYIWGSGHMASHILMHGIRWKWVFSLSPGSFTYLNRATTSHLREGWVSPRASLDAAVKRKCPCLIVWYAYLCVLCLIVLLLPLDENPSTV
jgi:hypothetical protein